jgi:hypothetical protein
MEIEEEKKGKKVRILRFIAKTKIGTISDKIPILILTSISVIDAIACMTLTSLGVLSQKALIYQGAVLSSIAIIMMVIRSFRANSSKDEYIIYLCFVLLVGLAFLFLH